MNVNDPFGFGRIQQMVQQTQKAVTSVQVVAAKLSDEVASEKHKPALDSLNKTMEAASGKLDKLGEGITNTEAKVSEARAQIADVNAQIKAKTTPQISPQTPQDNQ